MNAIATKVEQFIDAVQTITARDSFYNSKEDRINALKKIHQDIKTIDPDLYQFFMFYPGINDYNKLSIAGNILSDKALSEVHCPIEVNGSMTVKMQVVIPKIFRDISYPRVLKLFIDMSKTKVNNKRLKRAIVDFVLSDTRLLARAVTYRVKMGKVLRHAFGLKVTTAITRGCRDLLEGTITPTDSKKLDSAVLKYAKCDHKEVAETLLFIFRCDYPFAMPLYAEYKAAQLDFSRAKNLPFETLNGIRRNHHPKTAKMEQVIEKTKDKMTDKQKLNLQRTAKKAGTTIKQDKSKNDLVSLYKSAYELGWDNEMLKAVNKKADTILRKFNLKLNESVLIIDNSQSTQGRKDQKNDAITRILAAAKFFERASTKCHKILVNEAENKELPTTGGSTSFGKYILQAIRKAPEATVFILSDGYENAPEGLTDLVLKGLRNALINVPIIHINPVFGVEAGEVRKLSDLIPTLPIFDIAQLEGSFLKLMKKTESSSTYIESLKNELFDNGYKYIAGRELPEEYRRQLNQSKEMDFTALALAEGGI